MNTAAVLERGVSPGRSKRRHKRGSRSDRRTSQTARKDDLKMISGCVAILSGPGALWRIPGLEVPQIEAEMRAAWNIKTKFVDRWSHRHEPAAEQGASRRSPAQSDGGWPNRCTG
jgi:hypothetical protein